MSLYICINCHAAFLDQASLSAHTLAGDCLMASDMDVDSEASQASVPDDGDVSIPDYEGINESDVSYSSTSQSETSSSEGIVMTSDTSWITNKLNG